MVPGCLLYKAGDNANYKRTKGNLAVKVWLVSFMCVMIWLIYFS